jgi:hypothetical protein
VSRAIVKEGENDKAELPGRLISPHRNFVTEAGLAAIEASLSRFDAAHRAALDKATGEQQPPLCGRFAIGGRGAPALKSSNHLLTKVRPPSA